MINNLKITPEAERDIFAITSNIMQQDSIQTARKAISEFQNQLQLLIEHPDTGREGGCEGTREIVMKGLPYIAIYEVAEKSIIILRVLYGAEERRLSRR
jgi:addiction module RelE/StbE family toxin